MSPSAQDAHALAENAWLNFLEQRFDNDATSIHDLDRELALLQKFTALAKQKRNSRAGACHLPPEILNKVFHDVQKLWRPYRDDDLEVDPAASEKAPAPRYVAGWISITHVCSFWRQIALSSPALWQDIHILDVHPDYSYDILARSDRQPLRLTFAGKWTVKPEDAHVALAICTWFSGTVFRRLKALKIDSRAPVPTILQVLAQEAPDIEVLDIFVRHGRILPHLLNSVLPLQLRRLSIRGCTLSPDTRLLAPTLAHLNLDFPEVASGDYLTTAYVLHALSSMSNLETLSLYNVLRRGRPDDANTALPTVALPAAFRRLSLMMLDLAQCFMPVCDLLEHLSLPQTSSIDITLDESTEEEGFGDDVPMTRRLFTVVSARIARITEPLELSISSSGYSIYPQVSGGASVDFRHDVNTLASAFGMLPLLSALPSAQATSLVFTSPSLVEEIQERSTPEANVWLGCFSQARNVRSVTLPFYQSAALWLALNKPGSDLFPQVDTIILTHAEWSALRPTPDLQVPPLVLGLTEVIESRRETPTPIREVKVTKTMAGWGVWGAVSRLVKVTTI